MSAIGPYQTSQVAPRMSAYEPKADIRRIFNGAFSTAASAPSAAPLSAESYSFKRQLNRSTPKGTAGVCSSQRSPTISWNGGPIVWRLAPKRPTYKNN
jgi:hypothetical protein